MRFDPITSRRKHLFAYKNVDWEDQDVSQLELQPKLSSVFEAVFVDQIQVSLEIRVGLITLQKSNDCIKTRLILGLQHTNNK